MEVYCFFSSAKLASAGFIAALGLISFAWGVHCQTTVFILPFINDWWPFEIKQQMIAGIETGQALHDKDDDKTNMMKHIFESDGIIGIRFCVR